MNATETSSVPNGPGARLRQARHDLKLSPEDAAQILKLSPRQIMALEEDDYASLPGPTYVRGYLRSYAQFLGLAPEKIVDVYNSTLRSAAPAPEPAAAPVEARTELAEGQRQWTIGLAAAGIALVVIVAWWVEREPAPARSTTKQIQTYQTESGAIVTAAGTGGGGDSAPPEVPATPAPATVVPAIPATTPERPAGPPASPAAGAPPAARPAAAAAATPVSPPVAAAATGATARGRIVLQTDQESWVDIRDARQNRLLYENVAAGRTVTLEGPAPINVFLGNVDGVRLEYNGQPVDVSKHKRGSPVVRFTLGEGAAVP